MSKRWPIQPREEEEQPASATTSRLLVTGFLIAAGAGLLAGMLWIAWNLLR
jgi:hypothetical protein